MYLLRRPTLSLLMGGLVVAAFLSGLVFANSYRAAPVFAQGTVNGEATIAATPRLQYQGQLLEPTSGKPVANGAYAMSFRLYNAATGGSALWGVTQSVNTVDGLFSTLLAVDPAIFNGQDLYLGIQVGSDPEATPRQLLAYTAYAFRADRAGVADSSTIAQNALNADVLDGIDSTAFVRMGNNGVVAYGVVDANGGRLAGRNFSSVRDSDGAYRIEINGETYNLNNFVTVATAVTNSECPEPMLIATASGDGKLIVDIFDRSGARRACKFHFITLEP